MMWSYVVVIIASLSANNAVPVYVTEQAIFLREREEGRAWCTAVILSSCHATSKVKHIMPHYPACFRPSFPELNDMM